MNEHVCVCVCVCVCVFPIVMLVLAGVLIFSVSGGKSGKVELFSSQNRSEMQMRQFSINGSVEEPRVLRLQTPCGSEHDGYCFNGMCFYAPDEGTPLCRCHATFSGERCEHIIILENSRQSRQEEVIGISVGVSLLLCCLIIALYCCLKKRRQKETLPYKSYSGETAV
uniref:EGF-like domain-containing protein n=1 Tax=Denticeps clupeoides TaxID=299321 RepID=A0AAY4CBP3_9TELE